MAFLSFREIIDILIMCAFLGFIFKDVFKRPAASMYQSFHIKTGFDWDGFKFAAMATAPAVLLHEFGHKFVAMAFGVTATFHAAYTWLGLGTILKLAGVGFIFFVPAYVAWQGAVTSMQAALIALAGPAVNFAIWMISIFVLKRNLVDNKYIALVALTGTINKFLFIFNMIPIPGFDGFHFFRNIFAAIF